jgi:rod shape-determining protein MreC
MQNLLSFFIRFNGLFIFLLLEMIALNMMINEKYNPDHSRVFVSTSNALLGSVHERFSHIRRYWELTSINDSLLNENARLHAKLRSAYFSHNVTTGFSNDSLLQQQFTFTSATVVDNSTNRLNNYITLNRGTNHGIKPNSAVINGMSEGIVGIVLRVGRNYSTVMSILHQKTQISAKISKNNYSGMLTWDGGSPQTLIFELPKHATVTRGDSVMTSGYSALFPEGILVGTVDTFKLSPGSNFFKVAVTLKADLGNLSHVFVVDNLMKTELDSLNKGLKE